MPHCQGQTPLSGSRHGDHTDSSWIPEGNTLPGLECISFSNRGCWCARASGTKACSTIAVVDELSHVNVSPKTQIGHRCLQVHPHVQHFARVASLDGPILRGVARRGTSHFSARVHQNQTHSVFLRWFRTVFRFSRPFGNGIGRIPVESGWRFAGQRTHTEYLPTAPATLDETLTVSLDCQQCWKERGVCTDTPHTYHV